MSKNALNNTRKENFSEWYQEIIDRAELADNSSVRGCMVIKPYGYAIWENIMEILGKKIKAVGVQNAYFPLLIPLEFIEREAEHISGFAKETAVVTHHRLIMKDGKLIPDGELEKPYVIRPTSETIIGESFSKWIHSHKDLPMKLNQWCNVMRWEMRTRMFLRTSEFLWQEGHNVFATKKEAEDDARLMLNIYNSFFVDYLAIYGINGQKTEDEKFPGGVETFTIESMMQDGKALQSCTSHNLGQNFTKASNIKFTDENMQESLAYSTSWGASTRVIGGLIMSHSDDDGLVLPPNIAPYKIVLIPIIHDNINRKKILEYCESIKNKIATGVYIDISNKTSADKKWDWIRKGAPIKCEIGIKEVESNSVFFTVRNKLEEKLSLSLNDFIEKQEYILEIMQKELFEKNKRHLFENIVNINNITELKEVFKSRNYFVSIDKKFWKDNELEKVMAEYSLSYRCIPFDDSSRVIIGKSY